MRTYSFVKLMVDGKQTTALEIYGQHNVFHIYHLDENVFTGSWIRAKDFVDAWKRNLEDLVNFLKANGHEVKFEENF